MPLPPIKVLIVGGFRDSALPSGEEIAIYSHIDTLKQVPQVAFDTLLIRKRNQEGIRTQLTNLFWSFSTLSLLRKKLREFQPDVVHFHSVYPMLSFSVLWLCKKMGIKTVVTLHNLRFICAEGAYYRQGNFCDACVKGWGIPSIFRKCVQHSFLKTLLFFIVNTLFVRLKLGIRWVDRLVAVSLFIKTQYQKLGIDSEKITVIPICVGKATPPSGDNVSRKTIVFSGRLSLEKGAVIFLELCKRMPDYQFIAIGPLGTNVRLPSLKNLTWLGTMAHAETLRTIQERASLVIIPSICSESYNLSAHEALSMGIPILTSNFGNLPFLTSESKAGYSHNVFDLPGLITRIQTVHNDPETYLQLSQNGTHFIRNFTDQDHVVAQFLELYQSVLGR